MAARNCPPPRLEAVLPALLLGREGVFERVKGVRYVVSAYAGGLRGTPISAVIMSGTAMPKRLDHLRSGADQLCPIAQDPRDRGARSDASEPPGPGCRPELPLGDFPAEWRAAAGCSQIPRAATCITRFSAADRDADRNRAILFRRGEPPGFHAPQPPSPVHPDPRPPKSRQAAAHLPHCGRRSSTLAPICVVRSVSIHLEHGTCWCACPLSTKADIAICLLQDLAYLDFHFP